MERRAAQRTTYMSRTEVAWQDGNRELHLAATIEDRCSFGLGIAVSQPIPEGTRVWVAYQGRRSLELYAIALEKGKVPSLGSRSSVNSLTAHPFGEGRRAAVLQARDLLGQQLVIHADVGYHRYKRLISSSPVSFSRLFSMASPPVRKSSRHSLSLARVTRFSHEVDPDRPFETVPEQPMSWAFTDHRPAPGIGSLRVEHVFSPQNIFSTRCSQKRVHQNSGPGTDDIAVSQMNSQ